LRNDDGLFSVVKDYDTGMDVKDYLRHNDQDEKT